jgi:circadian clock protein KaiB
MATKKKRDLTARYQAAQQKTDEQAFVLKLYVTGATPTSTLAITNLKEVCEKRLQGRYQLEVIDIFLQPKLAEGEQIVAAPTLVKELPLPLRRFIGDLSGIEGKLLGLDLRSAGNFAKV